MGEFRSPPPTASVAAQRKGSKACENDGVFVQFLLSSGEPISALDPKSILAILMIVLQKNPMKNSGIRLTAAVSLLLLSVTAIPSGLVYAQTGSPVISIGTWTDTSVQSISEVQQGYYIYVTSTVCGTISGTIAGPYCAYGKTALNLYTGIATYSAKDVCSCDHLGASGSLTFSETGQLTPITSGPLAGAYTLQSTATIVKASNSYVTSGTIYLSGYFNPLTNLSWGSYAGTAQQTLGPGVNLQYKNLSGLDLAGFNLAGDNLQYTNLAAANLQGANLSGANLQYSNLSGATLTGLSPSQVTNFDGANMQLATLTGAICGSPNYITASGVNSQGAVNVPASCSPPL